MKVKERMEEREGGEKGMRKNPNAESQRNTNIAKLDGILGLFFIINYLFLFLALLTLNHSVLWLLCLVIFLGLMVGREEGKTSYNIPCFCKSR